ncbi:MAG: hypothetical protein IPK11_13380 [Ignavibacteria bacterium]|nr:hypothetical protein [Ignavibacteria bacterium]
MKKIQCKAILMNKTLVSLVVVIIVIATFLVLLAPDEFRKFYLTSTLLFMTSIGVFWMFYLNRNEVYTLIIDGEMLHLDFFNKSIFKRKELVLQSSDLIVQANDSMIELFYENKHIANIRKASMKSDEWEVIFQFLQK